MVREIKLHNPLPHQDFDIFYFSMCSCKDYYKRKYYIRQEAVNHEFRCNFEKEFET